MDEPWQTCRWKTTRTVRVVRSAMLVVLGFLSGCVVGPDFQRPCSPPLPGQFRTTEPPAVPIPDACPCWWEYFEDPVLTDLINQARQNNLQLRETYLRVREARARLGVVRGDWFPQVNGISTYSYRNISSKSSQFGNQLPSTPAFNFYSMGFDSSWEIDLFGKIARTVESAAADADAENEFARYFQVTLLADLATAYVQLRAAEQRLRVIEENLNLQGATLETVKHRQAAGLLEPLDEAQAQAHVLRTATRIPVLQQEIQQIRNRMAVLTGVAPGYAFDAQLGTGDIPRFRETLMTGVPADLLRRRPDVRQAEMQVASANALVGVAIAERLPQVTIRGTIDVESRKVTDLFTSAAIAHQLGPAFRWNILNFGKLRSNIELRQAQYDQSLLHYQQTVLLSVEEVENGLVGYQQQTAREAAVVAATESTQTAADLSRMRWQGGLVNFLTVVDTQRELLNVQEELVMSRGEIALNVIRVYKALGGGWQCPLNRSGDPLAQSVTEPAPDDSKIDERGAVQRLPETLEVPPSEPSRSSPDE